MRKILITFFISLICINTFAQNKKGKFTKERFLAELEQYITKEACLTPSEAAKFFPLYVEMRKKQQSLHFETKNLKRIKPTTDAACKKDIIKCDELEIEKKIIEKNYHKKFMQILPAKKVYDILKAEDRFHRQIFKRAAKRMNK